MFPLAPVTIAVLPAIAEGEFLFVHDMFYLPG
jgi:hypothetical protein